MAKQRDRTDGSRIECSGAQHDRPELTLAMPLGNVVTGPGHHKRVAFRDNGNRGRTFMGCGGKWHKSFSVLQQLGDLLQREVPLMRSTAMQEIHGFRRLRLSKTTAQDTKPAIGT